MTEVIGQLILDPGQGEEAPSGIRPELNEDVQVARRTEVLVQHGPEKRKFDDRPFLAEGLDPRTVDVITHRRRIAVADPAVQGIGAADRRLTTNSRVGLLRFGDSCPG